jgi:hypothetical protein
LRLVSTFGLILFCMVLAASGAWAMYRDGASYLREGATPLQRLLAIPEGATLPAISDIAQRNTIADCFRVMRNMLDFEVLALTDADRDRIAPICLRMAEEITASSPTFSLAWYVAAHAQAQMQNWDGFNRDLVKSQQTGAHEQWIGEFRVDLAEGNFQRLSAEALASHERDLRMLVVSHRGVRTMAARYANDPMFRERIAAILETVPEADQRQFIRNLQTRVSQ